MSYYRDIEDVVEAVIKAKDEGININLLIGAGCSVSANIPTANGIVAEIKKRYPRLYNRVEIKNYANCMSMLTAPERKQLIIDIVNESKINWAHIAIAQLLKANYIQRILTTNFDNLILRACSLVGEYPAIYDLATSKQFKSDLLFEKSVLHLHGQHTGFILCNTSTEVEKQAENLMDVFSQIKQKSLWIVVGYSGENDAIFDLLAKEESFEYRLFWVGYKDNKPSQRLEKRLLGENKYSFYVQGYNADDFFVTLTRGLKHFPPEFIKKPFSYLSGVLDNITPYKLPKEICAVSSGDLNCSTHNIISEAVSCIENNNLLMAKHFLTIGLYEEALPFLNGCVEDKNKDALTEINEIIKQQKTILIQEMEQLKKENEDNPNALSILTKWSDALRSLNSLEIKSVEIYKYISEINERFEQSTINNPGNVTMLLFWGKLLIDLVKHQFDKRYSKELLFKAIKIFKCVIEIDIDNETAMLYLGISYDMLNDLESDSPSSIEFLEESYKILLRAYEIYPQNIEILKRLGLNRMKMASKPRINEEGKLILQEACKYFSDIYAKEPKDYHYIYNWGILSSRLALFEKNDKSRLYLIEEACRKYRIAFETNYKDNRIVDSWKINIVYLINNYDLNENAHIINSAYDEYKETLNEALEYVDENIVDEIIDSFNSVAYSFIIKDEFIQSKVLLDICCSVKSNCVLHYATLGLWYLRNKNIDIKLAHKKGQELYKSSIKMARKCHDGLVTPLEQKFHYEMAYFFLKRKNDMQMALECCEKAYSYGEIKEFSTNFKDVVELSEELQKILAKDEVAATIQKDNQ